MCDICNVDKDEDDYELLLGVTEGIDLGVLGSVSTEVFIRKDPAWNIASVTTLTIGDDADIICDGAYTQIEYCPSCGRKLESE